jgi:hypothetical protein
MSKHQDVVDATCRGWSLHKLSSLTVCYQLSKKKMVAMGGLEPPASAL